MTAQSALPVSLSADGAVHTALQVGNLGVCLGLPPPAPHLCQTVPGSHTYHLSEAEPWIK